MATSHPPSKKKRRAALTKNMHTESCPNLGTPPGTPPIYRRSSVPSWVAPTLDEIAGSDTELVSLRMDKGIVKVFSRTPSRSRTRVDTCSPTGTATAFMDAADLLFLPSGEMSVDTFLMKLGCKPEDSPKLVTPGSSCDAY